ncbi:hypothetical protein BSKO_05801 [Bryopsis sp. KO-2023]|nr:hypothetical protein BSKO_05801 [Bryopsis sp. KO-2023]
MVSRVLLIVAVVGVISFTASGANDCPTKLEDLKKYYGEEKGCRDTHTILDNTVECSDEDKAVLGDCLKDKKTEWEYVVEHCLGSVVESSGHDDNDDEGSESAEAPEDNMDDSSMDGRRLMSAEPVTCLGKLKTDGLDGFPEVAGYKRSGALASTISGAMMVATAIVAMFL